MAEKIKAPEGDGGKTGRKAKKADNAAAGGAGHNTAELKAAMEDYLKRRDALTDDREKMNGEFAVDIGNLTEKTCNKVGKSKRALNKVYRKHRLALKDELERKEMEQSEKDEIDELMAACEGLKDTPLFRAALAKAGSGAAA